MASRTVPSGASQVRLLPGAVVLMLLLAVLPLRWVGWVGLFGGIAELVVSPIANPLRSLSGWLRPAGGPQDERLAEFEERIERLTAELNRVQAENGRLRRTIQDLQSGVALTPGVSTRELAATVISTSSDLSSKLLRVRAGSRGGVGVGAVAVGAGLQLVGRVVESDARTSLVRPISARESGPLRARVMVDESTVWLDCTLTPRGDGTLSGPVEYVSAGGGGEAVEPRPGMRVRLDDPAWPDSAQMFLVGEVERVEESAQMAGRRVVTVRPTLELHRLSELVLRVPIEEGEGPTGAPR